MSFVCAVPSLYAGQLLCITKVAGLDPENNRMGLTMVEAWLLLDGKMM